MNKMALVIGLVIPFAIYTNSFAKEEKENNEYKKTESKLKAKLYGNIKEFSLKLPATWIIKNKKVVVDKQTILDQRYGKLAKGVYVEVKGFYSGKDFIAKKIEVRETRDDDEKKENEKKYKSDKDDKNDKDDK